MASTKKSKLLLLLLLVMMFMGCQNNTRTVQADYSRIVGLANSLSFDQIVNELSSYSWVAKKDPSRLMIYCDALIEMNKQIPPELRSPRVPSHVNEFAQGYFYLRTYQFKEAMDCFMNLANSRDGKVWGYIGLLEYALRTENIPNMKLPLDTLRTVENKNVASVPEWVLPYYTASYYFFSGQFADVREVITKEGSRLDPTHHAEFQVHLLLREDKFKEAEEIIKRMPQQYQITVALEAHLVRLRDGPAAWREYLVEKRKKFPKFPIIEMYYADSLMELGEIREGISILKKLATSRKYDLDIQLDLAASLIDYEKNEGVEHIFMRVLNNPGSFLSSYDVLVAKYYEKRGQDDKALKYLQTARELFPKNPDMLWLLYKISIGQKDYRKAAEALAELTELEPNGIPILLARAEIDYISKNWKGLLEVIRIMENSGRYVDEETRNRVRYLREKAIAAKATNGKS